MMIRYWQPSREIETVRRQLDQVFEQLAGHSGEFNPNWMPAVELEDVGDQLILKAQLPGIDSQGLDIQVTREAVSLAGERRKQQRSEEQGFFHSEFRYGKFHRVIKLPEHIQNNQVQADFTDGILTLTLPKVQEARNKVVKINLGQTAAATTSPTLEAADNN